LNCDGLTLTSRSASARAVLRHSNEADATGWLALRTRSVVCAGLLHWVTNLTIYFLVLATR
jgi:hypothetical protein